MEKPQVTVVMVPHPSQSHLNQLLELSCLISSRGIPVHYIGWAMHNRQARFRANGLDPDILAKIHFHDIPTPPIVPIDRNPNTLDKSPWHRYPVVLALLNSRQPIGMLLKDLSSQASRIVIIHDRLVAEVVQDAVLIPNLESYAFNCISALNLLLILWEVAGRPFPIGKQVQDLPSVKEFFPEGPLHFIASRSEYCKERAGDIDNTIRLIESSYIDVLTREEIRGSKKQWAIRPSLPVKLGSTNYNDSKSKHRCLGWLDKQAPNSVILVSFGTLTPLSDAEASEIALGLEQSKHKFVWVLRDADKADIFAGEARQVKLPQGFEERMEGVGMVVRDWAPQLEILAHKSTGGFMSHCGWNSCLESITMGVPVAAWPMHSDQPINSILLTEILKLGLAVKKWTQKQEPVKASTIKNVVQRLMASKEGDEIRKRAEEIGFTVRQSLDQGGDSYQEFNSFIAHITR